MTIPASTRALNWFAAPSVRYRMVNHGNMSLAIEAGLAEIGWPSGCQGGREFIHILLAVLNGRQPGWVIATHQTIARLMSKGNLSDAAQRTYVSRQIAAYHRIAARLNRLPVVIESGTCPGNATKYDLRSLLKFALAVLSRYDKARKAAKSDTDSQADNFNPSAAIFSLISPALVYLPCFSAPTIIQREEPETEPKNPTNRVTHLGYQIRQQSPGFAKKLESHDFQIWLAAKLRIILEKARQGKRILPLHYMIAPDTCSCREKRKCRRKGKHPFGKLVKNGVYDATCDLPTLLR